MAQPRSRRLRLLESLRRTINEMLHERVHRAANEKGHGPPVNTSTIYTSASREAPELLDQLLYVHHKVDEERGSTEESTPPDQLTDPDRRAMLSAVRAAVNRTRERLDRSDQ
jgi:hypothetical protein